MTLYQFLLKWRRSFLLKWRFTDYFQPEKVRLQSLKAILKLLDLDGCSPYLGIYLVLTVED